MQSLNALTPQAPRRPHDQGRHKWLRPDTPLGVVIAMLAIVATLHTLRGRCLRTGVRDASPTNTEATSS